MPKFIDLTGKRFGRLVAVEYKGNRIWSCQCDCATTIDVRTTNLGSGNTRSCRCLKRETATALCFVHGHVRNHRPSRTLSSYSAMLRRCHRPGSKSYEEYGGRGISVCARWVEGFINFLADMGERPPGTSIDRVDNNGNYEPGNCRWATRGEQARNKSNTLLTWDLVNEIRGRREHGEKNASIARRLGLSRHHVGAVARGKLWPESDNPLR